MSWLRGAFIAAVLGGALLDLWLSQRQASTVARLRGAVPQPFAGSVSAAEHAKAAD